MKYVRFARPCDSLSTDCLRAGSTVSTRSVSTWETGDDKAFPRAVDQEVLGTFLSTAKPEIRDRFYQLAGLSPTVEFPEIRRIQLLCPGPARRHRSRLG